ncbi:MAG: hypothetical protein KDB26_05720 [Microthrixaceae bacterium]|nr:hypothetical protein [Microthrixaceae bacterium]
MGVTRVGTFIKGRAPSHYDIRRQHSREDHLWKKQLADQDKADDILLGLDARVQQVLDKGRVEADRAAKAITAPAEAEVKRVLSQTITQFTGGTQGVRAIPVWSSRLTPPSAVKLRVNGINRTDASPLLVLREGGGVDLQRDSVWRATARKNPGFKERQDYKTWARAARDAIGDALDRYPIIAKLRDDDAMAQLFASVQLTKPDSRTDTVETPFGHVTRTINTVHVPSLASVEIAADGLRLTYKHRPGDSASAWRSSAKLDALKSAFKAAGVPAHDLTVHETSSGDVRLQFGDRDPLEDVSIETGMWDDEKMRSLLGIDSKGREVWINWKNTSGMVVGGLAGSGKTASMLPVFRGMEGNAELYVFDGKAQRDLHPLRHIAKVYDNSGEIAAPLETVQMLEKLRVLRGDALYERLNAPNFWSLSSEQRAKMDMKPIFLILDECQVWLKLSKDKDKARIQAAILEAVENLIRMGRSAGIVVIITTQRPSAESIPTDVRDNAQLKLSFRVTNDIMAQMVLGTAPKGHLDPVAIPSSAKGRFVMDTEGIGMVLGQAGYIDADDLEAQLVGSQPVPDQWAVAEQFAGTRPSRPTSAQTPPPPPRAESKPKDDAASEKPRLTPEEVRAEAIRLGYLKPDPDEVVSDETKDTAPEPPSPEPPSKPTTTGFDF